MIARPVARSCERGRKEEEKREKETERHSDRDRDRTEEGGRERDTKPRKETGTIHVKLIWGYLIMSVTVCVSASLVWSCSYTLRWHAINNKESS